MEVIYSLFGEGPLVRKTECETAVTEAIKRERKRCARVAESYSSRAYSRRQILKPSTIANAIRKGEKK